MRGHRARTGGRLRLGDRGEPSQRWRLSDSPLTLRSRFPAWGVFQPQNSARCPEVTRNLGSGPEKPLEAAVFPGQSGERESESRRQRQPRQSSELPSVRTHRMHRVSQVAILSANPGSPRRDASAPHLTPSSSHRPARPAALSLGSIGGQQWGGPSVCLTSQCCPEPRGGGHALRKAQKASASGARPTRVCTGHLLPWPPIPCEPPRDSEETLASTQCLGPLPGYPVPTSKSPAQTRHLLSRFKGPPRARQAGQRE